MIWLPEKSQIRAEADGFVNKILVKEGSQIAQGAALVESHDPLILAQEKTIQARLQALQIQLTSETINEKAKAEKKITVSIDESGYPEELEDLVNGKEWGDLYPSPRKYLRRIPQDPFDRYDEGWGFRSYKDDPDSTVWGGDDIYDVYSQNDGTALDGTYYNTW